MVRLNYSEFVKELLDSIEDSKALVKIETYSNRSVIRIKKREGRYWTEVLTLKDVYSVNKIELESYINTIMYEINDDTNDADILKDMASLD